MIIGTAGHIDHGKTSLVRALTGVDTDRLKEEKARGISIDLGFAYLPVDGEETLGFIDVPGHEKFVHTMLAGASGIDFALLVVAADDGVMPQTREHVAILDLLGLSRGAVALTKADLVDADRIRIVEDEIAGVLARTGLDGAPIFPVSSATGRGVSDLRDHLAQAARSGQSRPSAQRFRLAVDRSFTLAGAGTIVTGTVISGTVRAEDRVRISPSGLDARVRSIRAQDRPAAMGRVGDRCGLNLAGSGISKEAIARGDVVLDPSLDAPTDRIDAELRLLASERKSLSQWLPVRLHTGAQDVAARIVLLTDALAPGETGLVQLVLERPIAVASGDRFVVRDTSAQRTIGGGRLLDLRAPPRKRRTPERLDQLRAHSLQDARAAVTALLNIPPFVLDLTAFCRDRALPAELPRDLVQDLALVPLAAGESLQVIGASVWEGFRTGLLEHLDGYHHDNPDLPGIGSERMRLQLQPRLPVRVFAAALHSLAQEGLISREGAWIRRAGFAVRLTGEDESLWAHVRPLIAGTERFRPPRVRDIAGLLGEPEADIRRLLKLLSRLGRVDEVAHDHFFLRATVAEMVLILERLDAEHAGAFTAAQFRDEVENGRKVAIQILEFFDRHGVTLRRGDLRRTNPHRLDLFRPLSDDVPATQDGESVRRPAGDGREASLVGRPDFKSGRGREPVLGGFDSHSLPPATLPAARRKP